MPQTRSRVLLCSLFLSLAVVSCTDIEPTSPTGNYPSSAPPIQLTVEPTATALADPGFEQGGASWQNATHAGRSIATDQVRAGARSLRMIVSNHYHRDVHQDLSVTPGLSYSAAAWIKTSGVDGNGASLRLVWLNSTGSAIATSVVGTAAPTQNWTLHSATVVAPAGATRVRYQLFTEKDPDNAGTAWFDSNVFKSVSGPPDIALPTVALSSPSNGAQVQGIVTVSANASDDTGIAGVRFFVNGSPISAEDTTAPYAVTWDTRSLVPGTYQLSAVARDVAGKTKTSAVHTVTVRSASGDTVPPVVTITAPGPGSLMFGTAVSVSANASDNIGVAGVLFRLDGQAIAPEDTIAPYSAALNTELVGNGPHVLTAVARDRAGNTRTSSPVSVTVYNQTVLDVSYCSPGGVSLKMDVYYPPLSTQMPAPVLMFIHGGGWQGGDKTSPVGMFDVPRFTKRGYVVVSINYRVWPHVFPAHVEDAKCAVRHLRANAAFYRIDPARVGVWGQSAGAHIAAMLATTNSGVYEGNGGYPGISSRVRAVVTYAGPTDLTRSQDFPTMATELDRLFGTNKIAASPITHVTPNDPPFLIVHGTHDKNVLMPQPQSLYNRLRAAGVSVQFLTVVNGSHTLVSSPGLIASPDRRAISDSVALFFDTRVK